MGDLDQALEAITGPQVRRQIASAARGIAADFLRSVRPLISYDDRERPFVEGSAVLLQIEGYRFLLTAAHVLDCPRMLYLAGQTDALSLVGPKYSTNPPQGKSRAEDKLDVAVLELATEYDDALGDVRFLGIEDLDVDERPWVGPGVKSKYLVLGYPSTGLRLDLKRHVITPEPFIYTANPRAPADYAGLGLTPSAHLVVEFDRRRVMSVAGQRTARKPKGISGGGMWRFDSLLSGHDGKNRLVALNIEWHAGTRRLLWGTRIALLLEIIRKNYPHLSSGIPRSRVLRVNVR